MEKVKRGLATASLLDMKTSFQSKRYLSQYFNVKFLINSIVINGTGHLVDLDNQH